MIKNQVIETANKSAAMARPTLFGVGLGDNKMGECGFDLLCGMGNSSTADHDRSTITNFMNRETVMRAVEPEEYERQKLDVQRRNQPEYPSFNGYGGDVPSFNGGNGWRQGDYIRRDEWHRQGNRYDFKSPNLMQECSIF